MKHVREKGFTLIETMVSIVVLAAVAAIVMSGMTQMTKTQGTIANRTEMHTSVRSTTELLEQEIGQAGKISLPAPPNGTQWQMLTQIVVPNNPGYLSAQNVQFSPGLGTACNGGPCLFDGEFIVVDAGNDPVTASPRQDTVQIHCAGGPNGGCTTTWNVGDNQNLGIGAFYFNHNPNAAPVPISVRGAFSEGIIPPAAGVTPGYAGYTDANGNALPGSTGTVLKMYGDINGDGNLSYIEYTCQPGNAGAPGVLYRNAIPFNAANKPALTAPLAMLTNVLTNPNDPTSGAAVPCFQYQVQTVGKSSALVANDYSFVTDVAVTLTEQTQNKDLQTQQFQNETKALLNVSPRNVFNAFELASQDYATRVQPTPPSVTNLLP